MKKLTKTNTSYCNVKVAKKTTWKYIFDSSTQNVVLPLYTHPSCFNLHIDLFMKSSPWPYTSPQECMKPIPWNHRAKQSPLHILGSISGFLSVCKFCKNRACLCYLNKFLGQGLTHSLLSK